MTDTQAAIIVAVIGVCGVIVSALISAFSLRQSNKNGEQTRATHLLINSRMDELLRLAASAARAEGVAAGEQSQRDRQSAPGGTSAGRSGD